MRSMRNLRRQLQDLWFCEQIGKRKVGVDTVPIFSKPEKHKFSVSATSGIVVSFGVGLAPSYDRYITSYDRSFKPYEGMLVFIDIEPQMDEEGFLETYINDHGDEEYITSPDYMVQRIYDTQKGTVARYGIKKL